MLSHLASIHDDGSLDFSQRLFPRLRSTYAQALFLHRVFPRATWTDELVRDEDAYARRGSPDWVSGACILVRRDALVELGGLDEGFFMYCEDIDLCRRLQVVGLRARLRAGRERGAPRRRVRPPRGAPAHPRRQPRSLRRKASRPGCRLPRAGRSRSRSGDARPRRPRRACGARGPRPGIARRGQARGTSHPARVEPPL